MTDCNYLVAKNFNNCNSCNVVSTLIPQAVITNSTTFHIVYCFRFMVIILGLFLLYSLSFSLLNEFDLTFYIFCILYIMPKTCRKNFFFNNTISQVVQYYFHFTDIPTVAAKYISKCRIDHSHSYSLDMHWLNLSIIPCYKNDIFLLASFNIYYYLESNPSIVILLKYPLFILFSCNMYSTSLLGLIIFFNIFTLCSFISRHKVFKVIQSEAWVLA